MLSTPFSQLTNLIPLKPLKTYPHCTGPCKPMPYTQSCFISGSQHIWIPEKPMSDRGQAPLDWLASFKKAQRAEQHRARPPRWVASCHITSQYPVNSFELNTEQNHSSTTAPAHISLHPTHTHTLPHLICTHVFVFFSPTFSLSTPLSAFNVGNYTKPPKECIYIKNHTMPLFKKYIDNKGRGSGKHVQPPPSKLD